MTTDFYSRDRNKAFDELKEELYDRLNRVREMLTWPSQGEYDDARSDRLVNEEIWLTMVLDKIERS